MLTAVVVLFMRYYANVENSISMSVVSLIAFLIYYIINWGLYFIAGTPIGLGYVIANSIIPIVYTLDFVFIVYKVLIKDVVKHHKDRYFI